MLLWSFFDTYIFQVVAVLSKKSLKLKFHCAWETWTLGLTDLGWTLPHAVIGRTLLPTRNFSRVQKRAAACCLCVPSQSPVQKLPVYETSGPKKRGSTAHFHQEIITHKIPIKVTPTEFLIWNDFSKPDWKYFWNWPIQHADGQPNMCMKKVKRSKSEQKMCRKMYKI